MTTAPTIPATMKPWAGGDSAPEDWDHQHEIQFRSGVVAMHPGAWSHLGFGSDIIAYTPKPLPKPGYADGDYVLVPRSMLEQEALARAMYAAWPHTVISVALAEATGQPEGTVLTWDQVIASGGSFGGLLRWAGGVCDALLAASPPTEPAPGLSREAVEERQFVAGPIWREEEEESECWTAEVQIVGGYFVVATVHGESREIAEQRQRAVLLALMERPALKISLSPQPKPQGSQND